MLDSKTPSTDALMAELDGELPPLAPGDSAPVSAVSRDAELTVVDPPAPSAVQSADAVHSTKAGGKGYCVLIAGEYFAQAAEGRGRVKKPYTAEFNVPILDGALSVIKNKLLGPFLRKKYPDFIGVRTNKIVDVRPLSPETPASNNLQYMTRPQLESHIKIIRAPIDVSAYSDVTHLRDAIIDYTQTPKGFVEREAARQADRKANADLAAMNPGIEVGA